ncbi:MAG: hypothetical protein NZM42_04200 [Gemmatales bacterium]|nr:hypothetical protein [Gemmatales bacterium]MDW8222590.1 hypothetical protein [Gemmatales bacterium]
MRHWLRFDWDVVGGIIAAVIAIILHLLHIVEASILLTIVLVLLAFLLLRSLRSEHQVETMDATLTRVRDAVREIQAGLTPPEVLLIGPDRLRRECARFVREARGEMVWFNMCCLMFRRDEIFELLIGSALQNPQVTALQFLLSTGEREGWRTWLGPRIRSHPQGGKLRDIRWLPDKQAISFILTEVGEAGQTEVLISFWGEPFMAMVTEHQVPRYVLRVRGHSDLLPRLTELVRQYRLRAEPSPAD